VIVVSSFGQVSATVKSSGSREVSHHGLFGEVEYIEWWDQGFKAHYHHYVSSTTVNI